jgi:multidrug efflux system outer membrane protein
MVPPYEAPAVPLRAAYEEQGQAPGIETAALAWPQYFSDPALQGVIALALDHNRDLRVALLHVEEARAAYGIQRSEQLPTVVAQAGVERSRVPADLNPYRVPLMGNTYQVGLGMASWEIDFWGRVHNLNEAALDRFLATEAARRAATVSLIAQVANSYLALRELDERIVLAQQNIASRGETLRIFQRRVEVGATSRLNLTQVQTLLSQAQALGAQLRQARALQVHALELLVGGPVELPSAPARLDGQTVAPLRAGLPSDLLLSRPDVVAAEYQLRAAHANIGAARAAFFPRLSLTASAGTGSAELGGLFDPGSQVWSFSPTLSLPLFDGGRLRNNLNLAEVRRDLAVASYEQAVQAAFRDVADALSAQQGLTEQLDIAQTTLAAQAERARLSQLRYDSGAAAFLEVLDAQRDLLSAEQQLVQVRRALLSSRVGLYAALGGGAMLGDGASTTSSHIPSHTPSNVRPAAAAQGQ